MPGWMRFVQAFVPVFVAVLSYTMWRGGRMPLWLVGVIFIVLLLGTTLALRLLQNAMARSERADDD